VRPILPPFCPTAPARGGRTRTTPDDQCAWTRAEQGRDCSGGRARTDTDKANTAENRKMA